MFCNSLNIVNVIKFTYRFNFLVLANLAVMEKHLSFYKRKER